MVWALATVALVLAALLPRRGGPTLTYLRSLAPTWRFFETVDVVPHLEACACDAAGQPTGDWEEVLPPPPRGPSTFFFNGAHTLRLAEHGVVEALLDELDGCAEEDVPRLVGDQLVRRMVARHFGGRGVRWARYRVLDVQPSEQGELYRSPPWELAP